MRSCKIFKVSEFCETRHNKILFGKENPITCYNCVTAATVKPIINWITWPSKRKKITISVSWPKELHIIFLDSVA